MNQSAESSGEKENSLPHIANPEIPVFDCRVILSPPDESGRISGRVANFPSIVAESNSERDVLLKIVETFKATVQLHLENNSKIPWTDPPTELGEGEVERWIPVHL